VNIEQQEDTMKILIAVDASACSRAAVDWVTRMTWPANSEFIVLSAAAPAITACPFGEMPMGGTISSRYDAELEAHEDIATECENQLRDRGWKSRAVVTHDDPRDSIVEVAKQHAVDLVVVGSHGRAGLSKLVMGSVADHLISHAPCPVLVIKTEPSSSLQPVMS
jgi:nucleotide-binding universal stress UspA family protein